jgi:hypothetical protein
MYSSLNFRKNSKQSGKLIGTHQKLDKIARSELRRLRPRVKFPATSEILYFEGARGPDGLKRKSPGIDEPLHFIEPDRDDKKLIKIILDHQFNLRRALKKKDAVRTAFEAAWLAHAITDGLTPAHHYPFDEKVGELMSDKDYKKFFGTKIKGIMRGDSIASALRNNWLYLGAGGIMTRHIAFEYGVATIVRAATLRTLSPHLTRADLKNIDLKKEFYASLHKIHALRMYDRFQETGWTTRLAVEVRTILIPEIVRVVTLAWASAL